MIANKSFLKVKWKGVVKFRELGLCLVTETNNELEEQKKCANFDEYAQFIIANGVIAINTASSHFADVVAPLYDADGNFKKFLCIQCCNIGEENKVRSF